MHINTLKEVHTDGDDYDSDAEQGDDFVPIADRDDQEPDQYDDDTETELMSDDEELIVDGQHIVMKGEKVTPKMVKDLFQVDERMKENAVRAKVRMSLIFASYVSSHQENRQPRLLTCHTGEAAQPADKAQRSRWSRCCSGCSQGGSKRGSRYRPVQQWRLGCDHGGTRSQDQKEGEGRAERL